MKYILKLASFPGHLPLCSLDCIRDLWTARRSMRFKGHICGQENRAVDGLGMRLYSSFNSTGICNLTALCISIGNYFLYDTVIEVFINFKVVSESPATWSVTGATKPFRCVPLSCLVCTGVLCSCCAYCNIHCKGKQQQLKFLFDQHISWFCNWDWRYSGPAWRWVTQ